MLISCKGNLDKSPNNYIKYNASNSITSLDPAFASNQDNLWAVYQLFNGLIQLSPELEPKPCIASSWEIEDEGKLFRFHLRQDVHFHDDPIFANGRGRKVNAHDFVYSFQRLIDPQTASPGAWIFNDKIGPEPFIALNDSVLEIRLTEAFAPFISLLSMPYCAVLPQEIIHHYGKEFSRHPIGTGPFKFKFWEEEVKLILDKNPSYFEFHQDKKLPLVDGLEISFIPNKQMALLSFFQGDMDFYNGIHSSIKDELLNRDGTLRNEYRDRFELQVGPVLNTEYLAINIGNDFQESPLANKTFRMALNHAIDRRKMIDFLRNNIGAPAENGFIPFSLPGFGTTGYEYNPEKAKELLKASGVTNAELILNTTKDYLDLSVFIQQEFARIGVKCQIEVLPSSRLKEEKMHGKLNFFRASWIADYPDAENYMSCFFSENFSPNGPNYTRFSNDIFDGKYKESLKSNDLKQRLALYREMDSIILAESPVIVLFYDQSLRLLSKRLKGLPGNAQNIPMFKYAYLENSQN